MLEAHGNRDDPAAPVTLHRVMQDALTGNLRAHYAADKDIPHSLLVLMMQIPDPQQRAARIKRSGISDLPGSRPKRARSA